LTTSIPAHATEIFKALGEYFIENLDSKEREQIQAQVIEVVKLLMMCVPQVCLFFLLFCKEMRDVFSFVVNCF
jgi:hypothetical protein